MPAVEPRQVEAMAAREAAASRLRAETRGQVEKIVRELEKLDVPSSPRPSRSCGATRRSDFRGTDRRGACLA